LAARKKKTVIGIVNPLCASAGYWIGASARRLIGVPSADIGSIGVFMCHYDCSAMLADAGIKPTFIFAGEYKVEGNSMEPLGEEAQGLVPKSEVDQTYSDFLAAVARGRGITADKVVIEKFGKGRCYGADGEAVGMIDEISTIPDMAQRWRPKLLRGRMHAARTGGRYRAAG
jgi:ClpP class serine protease